MNMRKTVSLVSILAPLMAPSPAFAAGDFWFMTFFNKGGFVMWPLLLCSVIAVAIALELAWRLQRKKVIDPAFLGYLDALSKKGDLAGGIKLCKGHEKLLLARIILAGLQRARYGMLEMERGIEAVGAHEATLLQRNLRGLGVLANITPMLGLLGTVIGMIKAFSVISESGTGDPGLVASGISEALITTAAGLIIGIPTLATYHYFRGKSDQLVHEMEEVSLRTVEGMRSVVHKDEAP